jgi:hypothetical protein
MLSWRDMECDGLRMGVADTGRTTADPGRVPVLDSGRDMRTACKDDSSVATYSIHKGSSET